MKALLCVLVVLLICVVVRKRTESFVACGPCANVSRAPIINPFVWSACDAKFFEAMPKLGHDITAPDHAPVE